MSTPTILIIDDNPDFTEMVSTILNLSGYVTSTANDGVEALEKLHSSLPNVILLDLNMPGMNGLELISKLKDSADWSGIPVIVLSSISSIDHPDIEIDGVRAFIPKGTMQSKQLIYTINETLMRFPNATKENSYVSTGLR